MATVRANLHRGRCEILEGSGVRQRKRKRKDASCSNDSRDLSQMTVGASSTNDDRRGNAFELMRLRRSSKPGESIKDTPDIYIHMTRLY